MSIEDKIIHLRREELYSILELNGFSVCPAYSFVRVTYESRIDIIIRYNEVHVYKWHKNQEWHKFDILYEYQELIEYIFENNKLEMELS